MELGFIDTHSHLYAEEFNEDQAEVVKRALESGVTKILLPSIDKSTFGWMRDLESNYPELCKSMIGLHPCSVKPETFKEELDFIKSELENPNQNYIAIGEIGMDLYWDKTTQDIQAEAFIKQCQWAIEYNLPIAIHSRNATKEIISLIKEVNDDCLTGVFHCFGDGLEEANEIIELGFKLGIGGVLTFKNSGLDKVMEQVDLEHLVLETDSPYLAPTPYRGKRNESAYIPLIAQKLADVKQVSLDVVREITTKNAVELFGI